jgi:outer membrane protein insertion porin family
VTIKVCFFSCLVYATLYAAPQDSTKWMIPDSSRIVKIIILGNDKTRDFVILREMKIQINDLYDSLQVEQDRKRIQNLHLFTRVEIQPTPVDDGVVLLITVSERWYIIPYPILYYNEKDWKKLSYGAGLIYQNFRGRNIDLAGSFWLGYNPGMQAYYSVPWFGGNLKLYSQIKIFSYKIRSKAVEYPRFDEDHLGISASIGKRWGLYTYLFLQAGYRTLKLPSEYSGLTASGSGTDHLPSAGLFFRYDTRDLYEYPGTGWYVDLYARETYNKKNIDYLFYGLDLRRYQPVWGGSCLALRGFANLTHGDVPVYDRLYIGYSERIRGHFTEVYEGEQQVMASVEFRFPIFKLRYLNLGSSAALGEYGSNLPFGLNAGFFYDTGAVCRRIKALHRSDFLTGFGAGLHFRVPYVDVIRLEYAMDTHRRSEVILDLYVWF